MSEQEFPTFTADKYSGEDNETAEALAGLIERKWWPLAKEAYDAMGQVRNSKELAKQKVVESDNPKAIEYRSSKETLEANEAEYKAEKERAKAAYEKKLAALEERFVKPENGLKAQKAAVDAFFKAAVDEVASDLTSKIDTVKLAENYENIRGKIFALLKSIEAVGVNVAGIKLPTANQAASGRKSTELSASGEREWTPRFVSLTVTSPDGKTTTADPSTASAAAKVIGVTRSGLISRLQAQLGAREFTKATVDAAGGTITWTVDFNGSEWTVAGVPDPKQIVGGDEEVKEAA